MAEVEDDMVPRVRDDIQRLPSKIEYDLWTIDDYLSRVGDADAYLYTPWIYDVKRGAEPRFDGDLAAYLTDLHNAALLPFGARLQAFIAMEIVYAEEEARRRRHRRPQSGQTTDWASADLLGEVEAVCGKGKRLGREWWFRCPFHNDKTASLEVDPERRLWHSFCCGKQGGVVDWRKACGS